MSGAAARETFASRLGAVAAMIGVAVGLGNVWRFPYMVGQFGGATFVLCYVVAMLLLGVPALMAEWTLGRHTRRGAVGAFARAGLPFGRPVGWFFFVAVTFAAAYYTNAVGWVLYYAAGEAARLVGIPWREAAILPPASGFDPTSLGLQMASTAVVVLACVAVLRRGLRRGIEAASKVILPVLLAILLILIARSLTLPGAWKGVEWYILKADPASLTPAVLLAALGQTFFSLSLGGTFMVVYGSYLDDRDDLRGSALWTAGGDLAAGLLAGLAILPAVFALGLEPASGPALLFFTLPRVFAEIPLGALFGLLFFAGLAGAAFLSLVPGFEVLVAGLTDNTRMERRRAVWAVAGAVFVFSLPPMVNMRLFVPWDLIFGSGLLAVGSLLAVLTVGWWLDRSAALRQLGGERPGRRTLWLYYWLRFALPAGIAAVAVWWVTEL